MPPVFYMQKLLRALLTVWAVVTFVFIILRISGDSAVEILGIEPAEVAEQGPSLVDAIVHILQYPVIVILVILTFVALTLAFRKFGQRRETTDDGERESIRGDASAAARKIRLLDGDVREPGAAAARLLEKRLREVHAVDLAESAGQQREVVADSTAEIDGDGAGVGRRVEATTNHTVRVGQWGGEDLVLVAPADSFPVARVHAATRR